MHSAAERRGEPAHCAFYEGMLGDGAAASGSLGNAVEKPVDRRPKPGVRLLGQGDELVDFHSGGPVFGALQPFGVEGCRAVCARGCLHMRLHKRVHNTYVRNARLRWEEREQVGLKGTACRGAGGTITRSTCVQNLHATDVRNIARMVGEIRPAALGAGPPRLQGPPWARAQGRTAQWCCRRPASPVLHPVPWCRALQP